MPNVMVGSITAELLLKTEQFDKSISEVEAKVKGLNTAFRGTDVNEMAEAITRLEEQLAQSNEEITRFEEQLEKSSTIIKQQSEVIEQLRADYESLGQEYSKVSEESNKVVKANEQIIRSNKEVISSRKEVNATTSTPTSPNTSIVDRYIDKLVQAKLETKRLNEEIRACFNGGNNVSGFASALERVHSVESEITAKLEKFLTTISESSSQSSGFAEALDKVCQEELKMEEETAKANAKIKQQEESLEQLSNSLLQMGLNIQKYLYSYESKSPMAKLKEDFVNFKLLYEGFFATRPMDSWLKDMEKANAETQKFSREFYELRLAMEKKFTMPIADDLKIHLQGVITELEKMAQKEKEVLNTTKQVLGYTYDGKMEETWRKGAEAVEKYHSSVKKNITAQNELQERMRAFSETYSFVGQFFERMDAELQKSSEMIAIFEKRFMQMESALSKGKKFTLLENLVPANMQGELIRIKELMAQVSAEESKMASSTSRLATTSKSATTGLNTMATATSKLKQGLSSLKMVVSTVSSMFIWTFGMSLWEATKQTVASKNEMESYLNQMGMGRGSINLFNQGLDETAEKFKKLNKYMIGETIAGIGMEFELNANQMKKAMDVVAMIQNEYVRAGRKEEEATLAVKDILQGEFLRLSRETGVGKNELIATGLWQGDLKDVEGLMEALRKVGTDRHWDLFASKCNSLNDVVSETKNRISEFGASLVDQLSPAIISGFNMIVGAIDKVTSTWNNFNPMEKLAVGIPLLGALGVAIMMVVGHLNLVDIATMGYSRSLITTILQLDVATVKEYGLATAITSKVTALKGSTVAELGSARAIATRLLGLDAELVAENGLLNTLALSNTIREVNTMTIESEAVATEVNTMAKELENVAIGEYTVVEELATAVAKDNIIAKETQAVANMGVVKTLAVMVTGEEATTVATWGTTEAVWALITSLTVLEAITVVAVLAGIAVALGSLAMEAQQAKESVDGFYDIVDNGDAYLEDAQNNIKSLEEQYNNLGNAIQDAKAKGEDTWKLEQNQNIVGKNLEVARNNLKDIQNVNDQAKKDAEDFNNQILNANTDFERKNAKIFEKLGKTGEEATELASNYTQEYLRGVDQMRTATDKYIHTLDEGNDHIDSQVDSLKECGAENETLIKYAQDYGQEILKNAEYQKEWAEGDFWAIFKIALSDLKLAWIDFTYWVGEQDWYHDLCNALGELKSAWDEFYTAIEPALPVLWEILQIYGSVLWWEFVGILKGIYYTAKLAYPVLKLIAEINWYELKGMIDALKWIVGKKWEELQALYSFLKPIADLKFDKLVELYETLKLFYEVAQIGQILHYVAKGFEQLGHDIGVAWAHIKGFFDWLLGGGIVDSLSTFQEQWDETSRRIQDGIQDWVDNFSDIIEEGRLGEEILKLFALNSFDIFQFLTDMFGLGDVYGVFSTFVQTMIATPLGEELNLFLSDPMAYMEGVIASTLSPESIINSLLGLDNTEGDTSAIFYNYVLNNIVTPFSNAIMTGLTTIPIVSNVLTLLGLLDSEEVSGTASEKGNYLGQVFGYAMESYIRNIPIVGDILSCLGMIDSTYGTANSKGDNVGSNVHDGVDDGIDGTSDLVKGEMEEVITSIANKVSPAYVIASRIGGAIKSGLNSTLQHHSPGLPAQLVIAEMDEIVFAIDNAVDRVYSSAQSVGQAINNGIQPTGEISFDADAMAQYQANTMMAMGMADQTVDTTETAFSELDYSTMTTFGSIGTTIGTTMTNIANTTKTNYNSIATTTKTQLANMQSQTTKNIGAIRQSWTGMQTALIQSAEHIRSETGSKIQSLQNNMATFWRKVQNPALLLGAGSPSEERKAKPRRYGSTGSSVRKILSPKGYAGSPRMSTGSISTGISNSFRAKSEKGTNILDALSEYLKCLYNGGDCVAGGKSKIGYAGGWDFNWSDDIKKALLQWHTHFGQIYDPYLYVGKFENDNFPVRGIAPIARNYIQDAISRTSYEFYYDGKYGSPLNIWNAGHFNCYDGALLVMALARAFGFPNSHMVHGSWGGIPHVWAYIEGLGNIDATAIQGGYGLTAPSRTGSAGGTIARFKHNKAPNSDDGGTGDVHIHIDMSGATVTDDSIGERIGKKVRDEIIDLFNPNPATGH